MEINVNELAVFITAVAVMGLGALWYSPILFGRLWLKLSNFKPEEMEAAKQKGITKSYIGNFITTLILVYALAYFLSVGNAPGASSAFVIGFWLWLGFVATVSANSVFWGKDSWRLYALNMAHQLVSILAASAILSAWPN